MDPREALRIAARSIRAHRLRSGLTVVGMVIGIASVIAFATFGASVQAAVIGDIGDTNANNVFITPASVDDESPGGEELAATRPVFTDIDVDRLREVPGVEAVIPQGLVGLSSVTYGNRTIAQQRATATVPETFTAADTIDGRGFEAGTREAVLNEAATRP